jgi:hypothetical protein
MTAISKENNAVQAVLTLTKVESNRNRFLRSQHCLLVLVDYTKLRLFSPGRHGMLVSSSPPRRVSFAASAAVVPGEGEGVEKARAELDEQDTTSVTETSAPEGE